MNAGVYCPVPAIGCVYYNVAVVVCVCANPASPWVFGCAKYAAAIAVGVWGFSGVLITMLPSSSASEGFVCAEYNAAITPR